MWCVEANGPKVGGSVHGGAWFGSAEGRISVRLAASWLNLAENFFSRFTSRYLARRRYEGLEPFDEHLYAVLNDYNDRYAKPLEWTYNPSKAAA